MTDKAFSGSEEDLASLPAQSLFGNDTDMSDAEVERQLAQATFDRLRGEEELLAERMAKAYDRLQKAENARRLEFGDKPIGDHEVLIPEPGIIALCGCNFCEDRRKTEDRWTVWCKRCTGLT